MIEEFIKRVNKEFHLKPGDKHFSPITQCSAYIALKYLSSVKYQNSGELLSPIFFCFPEKRHASVSLLIALLINSFNEDYIDKGSDSSHKLITGHKYSLYGSIGLYTGVVTRDNREELRFMFDGADVYCKKGIVQIVSKVEHGKIDSIDHYLKQKKKAKKKRNPISKILEPNEAIPINESHLVSRVILVAGRGETKYINEIIDNEKIYEKSIRKVFSPNDNIIITPDLNNYKFTFDPDYVVRVQQFVKMSLVLIESNDANRLFQDRLRKLIFNIEGIGIVTEEDQINFESIIDDFSDIEPRLKGLNDNYYPGIGVRLPANVRALILNDALQIEQYPNTIKGFLDSKIPVIVLINRSIEKSDDLFFGKRLFELYPDAFRFNWSSSKIKQLISLDISVEPYFDCLLWEVSKRYASQTVQIKIYKDLSGCLDKDIDLIRKSISALNGFEDFKKSFYDLFYPALISIKNSNKINELLRQLLKRFESVWLNNKDFISDSELANRIYEALKQLNSEHYLNGKEFDSEDVFCNSIAGIHQLFAPNHLKIVNLPSDSKQKIIFTGFPYNEYSEKHLINSVSKHFIPDIQVNCWPIEAKLTYYYLRKRIESGYFLDKLSDFYGLPNDLKITTNQHIIDEINSMLKVVNVNSHYAFDELKELDMEETEASILKFENYKYDKFRANPFDRDSSSYVVKCNIIRLQDGKYMFLPQKSTVIGEWENESGKLIIKKLKFNELVAGLRIYRINREQINYHGMLQNNAELKKAYDDLSSWKNALDQLLIIHNSIYSLSEFLTQIARENRIEDANPNAQNLRMWLHDDDRIAPMGKNSGNLKVILLSASEADIIQGDYNEILLKVIKAYKFVKAAHISLGHQINKAIGKKLLNDRINENEFIIRIENSDIDIESNTITALIQSDIEVDYSNTRKILC